MTMLRKWHIESSTSSVIPPSVHLYQTYLVARCHESAIICFLCKKVLIWAALTHTHRTTRFELTSCDQNLRRPEGGFQNYFSVEIEWNYEQLLMSYVLKSAWSTTWLLKLTVQYDVFIEFHKNSHAETKIKQNMDARPYFQNLSNVFRWFPTPKRPASVGEAIVPKPADRPERRPKCNFGFVELVQKSWSIQ